MNSPSDAELMERAAADDQAAFGALVCRYQDPVLNFFVRAAVSYVDGQDLAQRTFLRLWRYRKKYRPGSAKFTTFLFMMARQESIDFFRSEARRKAQREALEKAAAEPAPSFAAAGGGGTGERQAWLVRRAMAVLSPALRETLELVVFQDMRYEDAAATLGVPVGTVKSRMFNAMAKLKEALSDESGH